MRLHPSAATAADITPVPGKQREHCEYLEAFRGDVKAGLISEPKTLPCKYLYDERGSELFDLITRLPEYYLTRTELGILQECLPEVARVCGPRAQVVEYGSGSGQKTRMLLHALDKPTSCALVEISRSHLAQCVKELGAELPQIQLDPVCADYTRPLVLPPAPAGTTRRVAFFPGSTIGNFDPGDAADFLAKVAETVGSDGGLLIGVDLQKDESILRPAYDDAAGVTAAFNMNLLTRVRRELEIDVSPDDFYHSAPYNHRLGRMEMHLVARRDLEFMMDGECIQFSRGESIHTENSYKYTRDGFASLADEAGWNLLRTWTDSNSLFSVHYLTVK